MSTRLRRPIGTTLLVVLALVLSGAHEALAGELGIVVLDQAAPRPPGERWLEAEQRTRAELLAAGLSVITIEVVRHHGDEAFASLSAAARRHRAVAGLRLVRHLETSSVEIWLADEVTGKTSVRSVSTKNLDTSEAVALVALSVVELLNASLLELRAGHRSRGTAAPTDAVLRMVDESLDATWAPYEFAVRGGAGVIGSPGGLGLMVGPSLAAGWGPSRMLALEIDALGTAVHTTLEGSPGSARVGLAMARLLVVLRLAPGRRLAPQLGVGGGAILAWARGEVDDPDHYRAQRANAMVALGSATAGIAAHISRRLRMRLALGVGLAIPELSVELAGQPGAKVGRPLLDGVVGLEWHLFVRQETAP